MNIKILKMPCGVGQDVGIHRPIEFESAGHILSVAVGIRPQTPEELQKRTKCRFYIYVRQPGPPDQKPTALSYLDWDDLHPAVNAMYAGFKVANPDESTDCGRMVRALLDQKIAEKS